MDNNTRRNNQWRKLKADFNSQKEKGEGDDKAEYILLINLTINLDTHTRNTKAEENIKSRIFNLQFI